MKFLPDIIEEMMAQTISYEWSKASALSAVAQAMAQIGQDTKALQVLRNGFWTSRLAGREGLFYVLETGARALAIIDQGLTLRHVYEAVQDVDSWWGAE